MKRLLLLLSVLIITSVCFGQNIFSDTLPSYWIDSPSGISVSNGNRIFIVDESIDYNEKVRLLILDEYGSIISSNAYTMPFPGLGIRDDGMSDVKCLSDGGCIISGTYGIQNNDSYPFLLRTNSDGDSLWCFVNGNGSGQQVVISADGGFLLRTTSHYYKIDENGNEVWNRPVLGEIIPISDGYLFCKTTGSFELEFGKMDLQGNVLTSGLYSNLGVVVAADIELDNNGNAYVLLINYNNQLTFSIGWTLAYFDSSANVLGSYFFDTAYGPYFLGQELKIHNNEVFVLGYNSLINDDQKIMLSKLDLNGNYIYSNEYCVPFYRDYALFGVNGIGELDIINDNPIFVNRMLAQSGGYHFGGFLMSVDEFGFNPLLCSLGILELNSNKPKELIKIVNLLGQEVEYTPNTVLIYQYSDGTSEKVFTIED